MYVQDFTGSAEQLLAEAFASPKMHPKKNPTIEIAMRCVGDTVQKVALANLTKEIGVDLLDQVAMYEVNNGEYSELPEEPTGPRQDYESGMDDAAEAALEQWDTYLSADWLGKNMTETELWLSTDADRTLVEKLAASAAKEVFKQLTYEKTPAQVLSNAGITQADVEQALTHHLEATGGTDMNDTSHTLDGVIAKAKKYLGADFDQMAVFEDVETLVEEDDEILAQSAAGRLGLAQDDMEALQIAALDMDDPASDIVALIAAYKEPSKRSTAKAKKDAKAADKAAQEAGGLASDVFTALKDCGAGDTAMAEALGVSRSTYGNYVKGKTFLVPTQEQHALLRAEIVERANKLLSGLAALDGTELQQVA